MIPFVITSTLATGFFIAWYVRFSERTSRRVWAAYHQWVHRGF